MCVCTRMCAGDTHVFSKLIQSSIFMLFWYICLPRFFFVYYISAGILLSSEEAVFLLYILFWCKYSEHLIGSHSVLVIELLLLAKICIEIGHIKWYIIRHVLGILLFRQNGYLCISKVFLIFSCGILFSSTSSFEYKPIR